MFLPTEKKPNILKGNNKILLNNKETEMHEKNIEYLVNELKEAEQKMEKEKKEKTINNKNTHRISIPKISITPNNIKTIEYILSCKKRNKNMLIILNSLLANMKFLSIIKEQYDKEKLIASLSNCLTLEKKKKDSILFKYGNKGTKLYLVLIGEISVLILKEVNVELTLLNYIKYLLYLKIIKEDELAKKIVNANQNSSFKLTEKYLDKYYEDILSFINKYYIKNPFKNYKTKQSTSGKTMSEFSPNFTNIFAQKNKLHNMYGINIFGQINLKLNTKKIKSFKKQSTIDESRLSSVIINKNNILSINDDKKENKLGKVFNNMNENGLNQIFLEDEFFEKKYEYKPKYIDKEILNTPNYFELDIASFSPYEISNLVNYVIAILEFFSEQVDEFLSPTEYIKICSLNKYLKISDKKKKKEKLTIFQYFEITKKVEGDIFGELALQHEDCKRTATMIVTKDSVFGCLSKNDYNLCLKGIEMKKRKNDINFIISFSLFDEQNWVYFGKQYFNFFKKENLTIGKVLINQNEKIENIFFIMEGQIEISTKLSPEDIIRIMEKKNKAIKTLKKNGNKVDKNDIENFGNSEEEINKDDVNVDKNIKRFNIYNDESLISKRNIILSKKQHKLMKEIKNYRLYIIDNKDIIGLSDICNGNKISFIKATCLSTDAIVFSININILEQLRKKNWKIQKNYREISQKREKIMIERLKIVTNQVITNLKQSKIKNMINIKKRENINKEKRIISAFKTEYSIKKDLEYENLMDNIKILTQTNFTKRNTDEKLNLLRKKTNHNIYNSNRNNLNKKNNIFSDSEIKIKEIESKKEKKTGFIKFMDSVTERVNQINHKVIIPKFSRLFCPSFKKTSRLDTGKNVNKNRKFKIKEIEMENKLLKTRNNIVNVRKIYSSNKRNESDDKKDYNNNFSTSYDNIKEKHILSNKYINNIKNNINQNDFITSNNQNYHIERLKQINLTLTSEQEKKKYFKRILGVRYREYETSKGQKTFTKLMKPKVESFGNCKNLKYQIIKFHKLKKGLTDDTRPIKVDLLFYDQLIKKNKASYFKDIIFKNENRQKIISRNDKKLYKTIFSYKIK